jgi:hypothetical protein
MKKNCYIFYNPNPAQKFHRDGTPVRWDRTDCAVRALTKLENMSWLEAFTHLTTEAIDQYMMPNDDKLLGIVYKKLGYTRHTFGGGRRLRIDEFAKKHPKGKFMINLPGHVCALVNGKVYDTWDCSDRCICSWWEK